MSQKEDFSADGESEFVRRLIGDLLEPDHKNFLAPNHKRLLVEYGGSRGYDSSNFAGLTDICDVVLIEADAARFKDLKEFSQARKGMLPIRAKVGKREGLDRLDSILGSIQLQPFVVIGISIDVDGDDAMLFENMGLSTLFVIVEYNPALPPFGRFRNPEGRQIGNNLGELVETASRLGYRLIRVTRNNAIFLKETLDKHEDLIRMIKLNLPPEEWRRWSQEFYPSIDHLQAFEHQGHLLYGFGYDGTLIRFEGTSDLTGEIMHHGWSDALIKQPLPKVLRKFHGGKTQARSLAFFVTGVGAILTRPLSSLRFFRRRVRGE
jgi:hypothetical protein